MKTISISYNEIISTINLEAIKYSLNNNIFSGYEIIQNKKIPFPKNPNIYLIPRLASTLTIDIEIHKESKIELIKNVTGDVNVTVDETN